MNLQAFFESHSAPSALGFMLDQATQAGDIDFMQAVLEDIQDCKATVMHLEFCLSLETPLS